MSTELTNLLPSERRHAIRREYLLRFSTLTLAAVGVLAIVHGLLLVPAYAFVKDQVVVQEKRVQALSEERAVSGFTDLSERIRAFSERATNLQELRTVPSASEAVRAVLGVPHQGITLHSFTLGALKQGEAGRMSVSGTAATRESLRAFDGELSKLPFVTATDLPLSAYAKESDIGFSITLTLDFETP